MTVWSGLLGALMLVGAPPSTEEVQARYSPVLEACLGVATDPVGQAECYRAEFRRQDASLNKTYEQLMLARSGEDKASLRYKQRAWIRAKEAACASEAIDADQETVAGVAGAACYLRWTAERVIFLERMGQAQAAR